MEARRCLRAFPLPPSSLPTANKHSRTRNVTYSHATLALRLDMTLFGNPVAEPILLRIIIFNKRIAGTAKKKRENATCAK